MLFDAPDEMTLVTKHVSHDGWIAELAERTDRTEIARSYGDSLLSLVRSENAGEGADMAGYRLLSSLWLLHLARASNSGDRDLAARLEATLESPGRGQLLRGGPEAAAQTGQESGAQIARRIARYRIARRLSTAHPCERTAPRDCAVRCLRNLHR